MGIQDEMYMTQQREQESLKRNHEDYECEHEALIAQLEQVIETPEYQRIKNVLENTQ